LHALPWRFVEIRHFVLLTAANVRIRLAHSPDPRALSVRLLVALPFIHLMHRRRAPFAL